MRPIFCVHFALMFISEVFSIFNVVSFWFPSSTYMLFPFLFCNGDNRICLALLYDLALHNLLLFGYCQQNFSTSWLVQAGRHRDKPRRWEAAPPKNKMTSKIRHLQLFWLFRCSLFLRCSTFYSENVIQYCCWPTTILINQF